MQQMSQWLVGGKDGECSPCHHSNRKEPGRARHRTGGVGNACMHNIWRFRVVTMMTLGSLSGQRDGPGKTSRGPVPSQTQPRGNSEVLGR